MLVPLYSAGASFGYTGSLLSSMLTIFLFMPILPLAASSETYAFDPASPVILLCFFIFFGIFIGGTVGAARKTSRYVDTLSHVFMRIQSEQDESAIMRCSCLEAAALTEAAGGAMLFRRNGASDPCGWTLSAMDSSAETITGLPSDNILAWCARKNMPIATNSLGHDERFTMGAHAAHIKSVMAVPVSYKESVYGAILLMDRKDGENFSARDLSITKAIAETAGGSIHNIVHEKERQQEKLHAEQMRELFSRFVSSSVADYVLEHPGLLKGRWQEVTVLVSDIRDFTAISEKVAPRELLAQLNEYFTAMVDVIFEHKGTIDKFIGDCIIAYWGAPAPDPDHAAHAIRAAGEMSRALDTLHASWAERGMPLFATGIAIHTCDVLIGNLGDERKKAFTIMGEEVDKAIGLESLTKSLGARIIVSETAARAAGDAAGLAEIPGAPPESGRLFSPAREFS